MFKLQFDRMGNFRILKFSEPTFPGDEQILDKEGEWVPYTSLATLEYDGKTYIAGSAFGLLPSSEQVYHLSAESTTLDNSMQHRDRPLPPLTEGLKADLLRAPPLPPIEGFIKYGDDQKDNATESDLGVSVPPGRVSLTEEITQASRVGIDDVSMVETIEQAEADGKMLLRSLTNPPPELDTLPEFSSEPDTQRGS